MGINNEVNFKDSNISQNHKIYDTFKIPMKDGRVKPLLSSREASAVYMQCLPCNIAGILACKEDVSWSEFKGLGCTFHGGICA